MRMSVPEYKPSDTEYERITELSRAYDALRKEGWREIIYAPRQYIDLWLIEPGSTGFHAGYRDDDGSFWIIGQVDTWPSNPTLFKLR